MRCLMSIYFQVLTHGSSRQGGYIPHKANHLAGKDIWPLDGGWKILMMEMLQEPSWYAALRRQLATARRQWERWLEGG